MMLMHPEMMASEPIWLIGLTIIGFAVLGAVGFELLTRRAISLSVRQQHNDIASAIFGVIGTTYAVLLAFVAMLAFDTFNKAQAVTETEASQVQNIYQLVGALNGPQMASVRSDIEDYARRVVTVEWPAMGNGSAVAEDAPSLVRLTQTALQMRPDSIADGNVQALLLNDLTRLADARRERLLAGRTPFPSIVWFVLVAGGGITVAFGSFLGATSLRMHLAMSTLLATSGALVLLVIIALSNPFRGDFRISPEPFERVLTHLPP